MENMKSPTANEKCMTVMDDPNTEKYCFADQYEFMMTRSIARMRAAPAAALSG